MVATTRVRKAVLPVAGLGTRVLPAVKAIPKEMLPIVDRPVIEYAVDEARQAGIEEFIFVTARGKTAIEDHFDRAPDLEAILERRGRGAELESVRNSTLTDGNVTFTRQHTPSGLGHAVWCARHAVGDEPFGVILPDDLIQAPRPVLGQLIEAHQRVGGNVVAAVDVPREQTNRYGVLDVTADDGTLAAARGMVEKPEPEQAPSTLSIIGRYVLDPSVMRQLDRQDPGRGNEIQLTDAIAATVGEVPLHGLRFDGRRFDCGNKAGYVEAILAFALEHPETAEATRELLQIYAARRAS
jgi:UTP--glucose-1-phosphate uridylyltransferase